MTQGLGRSLWSGRWLILAMAALLGAAWATRYQVVVWYVPGVAGEYLSVRSVGGVIRFNRWTGNWCALHATSGEHACR